MDVFRLVSCYKSYFVLQDSKVNPYGKGASGEFGIQTQEIRFEITISFAHLSFYHKKISLHFQFLNQQGMLIPNFDGEIM